MSNLDVRIIIPALLCVLSFGGAVRAADDSNGSEADGPPAKRSLADATRDVDVDNIWENEPVLGAGLSLYKPNYLMPVTWSDETDTGSDAEAQYQISFKQRVGNSHVFLAYTQTSFWRLWDGNDSRPFRETNFMPEIFYRLRDEKNPLGPFDLEVGLEHQSNGEPQPSSRSWNRVYLRPVYKTRDWRIQLQVWRRVFDPDEPSSPSHPEGDDNPDITDYLGYHELQVDWRFAGGRQLSFMSRYRFEEGYGALRLRYTEPTTAEGFYWFAQLFHGYGESLIDYDRNISRIGLGFAISR